MLPSSGPILGKYTLHSRLAIGGMGEVFFATSPSHPDGVVVKRLLPELARQEGYVGQFIDEARLLAAMRHPNIVATYNLGRWDGTYVLALEYVHGRDLAEVMRQANRMGLRMPPLVAACIIRDGALALHHAHTATDAQGKPLHVLHRDVSPDNLVTSLEGVTKVLDFGIAGEAAREKSGGSATGKLHYLAPEQAGGQRLTASTDQFALGLVFWELVAGRRAYAAESEMALLNRVLEGRVPAPPGPLPPELEQVLMRMVSVSPAERFPSCADVAKALKPLLPPDSREQVKQFMAQLGTAELDARRPGASKPAPVELKAAEEPARPAVAPASAAPVKSSLKLVSAYLATIPGGLEAAPEVKQKASIIQALLKDTAIKQHVKALPPPLAELVSRPPLASTWVPLVQTTALLLAAIETCFPSEEAFVDASLGAFRKLFESPLYAMFFKAPGWKQLLQGLPVCWEQVERGASLKVGKQAEGEARFTIEAPAHFVPAVVARSHAQRLRAQLEVGGLKEVQVTERIVTPTQLELSARWK